MDIRSWLKEHTLLFDGGMSTYYAERNNTAGDACEWANLSNPQEVEAIHRAYLEAGCRALKTNTYGINRLRMPEADCKALIRAACEIARRAAKEETFLFSTIGPIEEQDDRDLEAEYRFVVDCFLELGMRNFLIETHSSDLCLHETAAYIKARAPEAFIILSFNVQPDGFTTAGRMIRDLCKAAEEDPNVDAVGMNCMTTARHMVDLLRKIGPLTIPISVMPNASYPTVRGNRSCYDGDPAYFAAQMAVLRDEGAWILGGCCGTTPAYIAATAKALEAPAHIRMEYPLKREKLPQTRPNPFWDVLCDPDRKAIAVELDPPEGADLSKFMTGARELRAKDVDIITIADCPVARVRVDSSLMACKLHRELGMSALPHMTCRDRNLNATQALLLGLCAEGIGNVLVVTGDPIPNASRDEVKSVYNFNSRRLIRYIRGLNEAVLPTPFHIFAALNVNARNFRIQLEMAKEKEENGADAFLTQPVLSPQAAENLMLARETLKGKLLCGIMPVVSQRNALFMNSEISGISVAPEIIARYENADRTRGEELAVEISAEFARRIADSVDGYYLMTPFGRTGLIARILDRFREEGLV